MQPVSHAPRPDSHHHVPSSRCAVASALPLMGGTGLPLSALHHAMVQISQSCLNLCLSAASWKDTTSTLKCYIGFLR